MSTPEGGDDGGGSRDDAALQRLVRREAEPALRKAVAAARAEDVAAAMDHLTWLEQRRLYRAIDDPDQAAAVLAHLSDDAVRRVTAEMTEERVADLLDRLEPDDATDVMGVLADDVRARVLAGLDDDDQAELAALLAWPPDSAGGIMSTDVFTQPTSGTCGAAIRTLQRGSDELVNVHYVYVVDAGEVLVGVVSLRELVVHPPTTPLLAVMTREVIAVRPMDDQEDVARLVARYDLLAVPVVDPNGVLLGIVTVDDVLDVVRDEAVEDMYRMVGLSEVEDPSLQRPVLAAVRHRAGWLFATIVGGVVASELIRSFQGTLERQAVLAGFIPVVMGMGGNVGIQAATLAVRGLATGGVQLGGAVRFVWHEVRVGVVLGAAFGLLLGGYAALRYDNAPYVGASVGLAVVLAVSAASLLGAGVPVFLSRLDVDPAVASGPLVTMSIDLVGIAVYLSIATALVGG
ncbi:MAG: magnesium transporter [Alphaproteobacteria bacterium]|nr:magnesium transporter [Alphaproteobacteria bacterium]